MLIAVWYSQSFLFLAVINILVMASLGRKKGEGERKDLILQEQVCPMRAYTLVCVGNKLVPKCVCVCVCVASGACSSCEKSCALATGNSFFWFGWPEISFTKLTEHEQPTATRLSRPTFPAFKVTRYVLYFHSSDHFVKQRCQPSDTR